MCCWLAMLPEAFAHHPTGKEPVSEDIVVARVYTTDEARVKQLAVDHDLWYYIWRDGYAVIRSDRSRLPRDAQIDREKTLGLKQALGPVRSSGSIPARPCYRTVEQTYSDLQALALAHPDLAHWIDYGDSWEKAQALGGYDLTALVLSNQNMAGPKPVAMIISATHARELTTAETTTRFAEMLIDGYGSDPDITWMLDYFEIHVLAHHNPDGRKLAEAQCTDGCTPNWRKNTNQGYCGATSPSRGADLNRNSSSSFWGGLSSSGSECSSSFRGSSAASEPEALSLEIYAEVVFPDFRNASPNDFTTPADPQADGVFVSVHSSGDIVFYPWEGINDAPPNQAGLRALAQKMGFATTFAACQNCFLGPASGTNVDYIYEKLGIPAFTFEIGTSFAESCENFESTVLPQTLDGLMSAVRHSRRPYQTSLGPDVLGVQFTSTSGGEGTLSATADDTRRAVNGGGEPLDASQPISSVRYSVGAPPWMAAETFAMAADDGAFDQSSEGASALLTFEQIGGDRQLVFVYAEDADGNTGPPSAVWVNFNSATLQLQKAWTNGVAGDTADLTLDGVNDDSDTSTATGDNETDTTNTADTTVLEGEIVTLSELPGDDNGGNYTTSFSCTGNTNPPTYTLGAMSATLLIDAADTAIICTYTNTNTQVELFRGGFEG
jgi:hypothetical protein